MVVPPPSRSKNSDYLAEHMQLFENSTVLELGAGAVCLQSLLALKLGARKVYVTDRKEALELIRQNVEANFPGAINNGRAHVLELDWNADGNTIQRLPETDLILGSDVFFDSSIFEALIRTIRRLIDQSPRAKFIFAYQVRDTNWSIECLLHEYSLSSKLLRTVNLEQTIFIAEIMDARPDGSNYFIGVEGGATQSKFILISSAGEILQSLSGDGLNCLLEGVEKAAECIASKARELIAKSQVKLPVKALALGLAGAENPDFNQRFLDFLRSNYGDLAENWYLNTDAVVSIAANFPLDSGAIVLIAGTGSSARLLMPDGTVYGAGGWGHVIGDGGSAYWIANRCMRRLFDYHDGLLETEMSVQKAESTLLTHFNLQNRLEILDLLYGNGFSKSKLASFCESLARSAREGDEFSKENFFAAGFELGRHLVALSKRVNHSGDYLRVLGVGSLFESFDLLKDGFQQAFQQAPTITKVKFFRPTVSPAVGAAILGAKQVGVQLEIVRNPSEICELRVQ